MGLAMLATQVMTDAYMGTDATSDVIDCSGMQGVAFQAVYTGTPTGVFKIQGSVNYNKRTGVGTWTDVDLGTTLSISAAGDTLIDITNTAVPYLRLFYDFSSGTGTLNAWVSGKRF